MSASLIIGWVVLGSALSPQDSAVLDVSTIPSHIILGQDDTALVTVIAPPGTQHVKARVNVGQISEPSRDDNGGYRFTFTPPATRFPQVAIVAVSAEHEGAIVHGWTTLPLWGQGSAVARTKPGAMVTVELSGRRFGPERANASGVARVSVQAPPGIRSAIGNRDLIIDLNPPDFSRVLAHCHHSSLAADQSEQALVRVYVVDSVGNPTDQTELKIEVSSGKNEAARNVAPGVFEITWHLPPRPVGSDVLSVSLAKAKPSSSTVSVMGYAGLPANLAVGDHTHEWIAGQSAEPSFEFLVTDAAGNPADGQLRVRSEIGEPRVEAMGGGRVQVTIAMPEFLQQLKSVELHAWIEGRTHVSETLVLAVRPASPANIKLRVVPPSVEADGSNGAAVRPTVTDRFGNTIDIRPILSSVAGDIEQERGDESPRFVPHRLLRREQVVGLNAAVADVSVSVDVKLRPTLGRVVLSPQLGMLTNFGQSNGPLVGAGAAWWPGWAWWAEFGVFAAVDYAALFARDSAISSTGASRTVQSTTHLETLQAGLRGRKRLTENWVAWLDLSAGLALTQSLLRLEPGPRQHASGSSYVADLSLSVGTLAFDGQIYGSIGYRLMGSPNLGIWNGIASFTRLAVGYRFDVL